MKGLINILITVAITMAIIAFVFRVSFIRRIVVGA
jgi:hypothetical protein